MIKSFGFSFLIFLLIGLTTCQSFNSSSLGSIFQEPKVLLNSVDIAGISLSGVDLIARVDVENPNGFSIPMPKIDWELFINSASFMQGVKENSETLGSRGKVTMDVPLRVSYDGLFRSFSSLIVAREAAYKLAMGLTFPIPIIENKVFHLDYSGLLPLR